jgi:hypothetical protein
MTAIHTVEVSGETCMVTVRQKSARVWVARGTYMGDLVRVQERSEEAAVTGWQKMATSKASAVTRKPRPPAKPGGSSPGRKRKKKAGAKRSSPAAKSSGARKKPAKRK